MVLTNPEIKKKSGVSGSSVGWRNDRQTNRLERMRKLERKLSTGSKRKKTKNDIDLEQVYQCCRVMCSAQEVASILKIPYDLFSDWMTSWPELADTMQLGYNDTRNALRKTQLDLALGGHSSMLMWLGKQYLGQADQHKVENKTEINVTVQRAMDELRNIPKDKLLEAMALIESPVIDNQQS